MKKSKFPVSDEYIRNFGKRMKSNLWKARLPAVKEWEKEEVVDYRMYTELDYSTLEGVHELPRKIYYEELYYLMILQKLQWNQSRAPKKGT